MSAVTPGKPRVVRGPTALGDDLRRFWTLTWTLAITDFRLKFFGSVLGYFWQLARPLMLFGVLFVVFSIALDVGGEVEYFPQALLLGIVLYSFLNEATSQGLKSLVTREPLVRKVDFPRLAVPLSNVLTAIMNLGLNLVPVVVFLLAAGAPLRWTWLWFLPLIAVLIVFVAALATLLSALYVRYRDIEPIWDVVLQIMFYATPIFYPIQLLVESEDSGERTLGEILMCNPFAAILQQIRHWVVDPSHLSAADALGATGRLLIPTGIVVLAAVVAWRVFSREAPRIAEDL